MTRLRKLLGRGRDDLLMVAWILTPIAVAALMLASGWSLSPELDQVALAHVTS